MITDRDIRTQVETSVETSIVWFDIDGIVAEIQATYGLVDIDTIADKAYWEIVERHAI